MKKFLVFLVVIAVGLAGVAYYVSNGRRSSNSEDVFTFAPVEHGSLTESVGGSGMMQPRDVLIIMSKIPGSIVEIRGDFNQTVEEDQILLRLYDRDARLKLDHAEVAVKLAQKGTVFAQKQFNGARKVLDFYEKHPEVRSEKDYIKAQHDLEAAEAVLEAAHLKVDEAREVRKQAEHFLSLHVIRVPVVERTSEKGQHQEERINPQGTFAGSKRKYLVMDRKVSLNRNVGPAETTPLFTLVGDLDQMQLQAQVAEGDISKIKEGLAADFTVSAYSEGNVHFAGKVSQIRMMPVSELGAVFYRVIIDVENQRDGENGPWKLRPGMTASVDIITRKHDNRWKMPTSALSFQLEEQYLTEAARAKLARWENHKDRDQWKPVWVLGDQKKPWPVFVRLGGKNEDGKTGIRDAQYSEVLKWDPELKPAPDSAIPATIPRVIIGAPPAAKSGLFSNMPNIKL